MADEVLDRPGGCADPWIRAMTDFAGASVCCHGVGPNRGVRFPLKAGPHVHDWRWFQTGEVYTGLRRRMLEGGASQACPKSLCGIIGSNTSIRSQLDAYRKVYPHKAWMVDLVEESVLAREVEVKLIPRVVNVTIGHLCNAGCPFCIQGWDKSQPKREDRDLSPSQLDALGWWGAHAIRMTVMGGEVFAYPDEYLGRVFYPCHEAQTPVRVVTNGLLLTLKRYNRWVVNGPIDTVQVSIDTVDPEAYRIHRGEDVSKLIRNLEAIAAAHPDHRIHQGLIVLSKYTLGSLRQTVQWIADLGIKTLTISPIVTNNVNLHRLDWEEWDPFGVGFTPELRDQIREEVDAVEAIANKYGMGMAVPQRVRVALQLAEGAHQAGAPVNFKCVRPEEETQPAEAPV